MIKISFQNFCSTYSTKNANTDIKKHIMKTIYSSFYAESKIYKKKYYVPNVENKILSFILIFPLFILTAM